MRASAQDRHCGSAVTPQPASLASPEKPNTRARGPQDVNVEVNLPTNFSGWLSHTFDEPQSGRSLSWISDEVLVSSSGKEGVSARRRQYHRRDTSGGPVARGRPGTGVRSPRRVGAARW